MNRDQQRMVRREHRAIRRQVLRRFKRLPYQDLLAMGVVLTHAEQYGTGLVFRVLTDDTGWEGVEHVLVAKEPASYAIQFQGTKVAERPDESEHHPGSPVPDWTGSSGIGRRARPDMRQLACRWCHQPIEANRAPKGQVPRDLWRHVETKVVACSNGTLATP